MDNPRVLVIDDEKSMCELLSIMFKNDGYETLVASDVAAARRFIEEDNFDIVITDLRIGTDRNAGMKILSDVQKAKPDVPAVMITAYGSIDTAIEAIRKGAYHYLVKPFKNEEMRVVVSKALEQKRLKEEHRVLLDEQARIGKITNLIGQSSAMVEAQELIRKVAPLSSTVLIHGESGTGKELVARAIHDLSPRREKPFVAINCAGIPENLLESELFGHKRGSFTGAVEDKKGMFAVASGGTLFLDEIGDMPFALQAKLLRALDEKKIKPVGSTKVMSVDVRLVSATNKDLEQMVADGSFREDLYYRLNVIPIVAPPLRGRTEDIPLLVKHFVKQHARELGTGVSRVSSEAMSSLEKFNWPGNVRELENVVERAVALCSGDTITPDDLPAKVRNYLAAPDAGEFVLPSEGLDLEKKTDEIERVLILQALAKTNNSQKKAAELLNLTSRSLRYRLKKHRLSDPSDESEEEIEA